MHTNFLQELPYIGRARYREVSLRVNESWDLKIVSDIDRRPL